MSFTPENPANPQDLVATFDIGNRLNGLLYMSPDEGTFSRVNGEWQLLGGAYDPIGQGVFVVFVKPEFIMEYDSRMMYREYIPREQVKKEFGVTPQFGAKK